MRSTGTGCLPPCWSWGCLSGTELIVGLALIWIAHIGMDRLLGYGLKYPSGFRDTHLGAIGRR